MIIDKGTILSAEICIVPFLTTASDEGRSFPRRLPSPQIIDKSETKTKNMMAAMLTD
jgi:hypothetical protein